MKILVIDDSEGILFVMRQALELKHYEVYVADSFEGIGAIEESAPDLIYLDVSLVGYDGRAVSQELKRNETTKHIPIVLLTGHPQADVLVKEAEADDYLSKPFSLTHLWEKTEQYAVQR